MKKLRIALLRIVFVVTRACWYQPAYDETPCPVCRHYPAGYTKD